MAKFNGPKIVTNGLVLCLDAGNRKSYPGSGTTWTDLSGQGNNGSLVNGPTFDANNAGSIVFDGTNDFISSYDLSWNNTNSVSISMFIKPASLSTSKPIIGKQSYEWQIIQLQTSFYFIYWDTTGNSNNGPIVTITDFYTSTNFVNVLLVWNHSDNKYYFYKNAELVGTTTWTDASINRNLSAGINIGGNIYAYAPAGGGSYWNGSIGLVQVYNRALSAAEIQQNFNATRYRFGI